MSYKGGHHNIKCLSLILRFTFLYLLAKFSNRKEIFIYKSLSFQDGWPVCAQEVHQDDEDLQPRQGLQEEQQVWILLKSWPHSTSNKSHNIQAQMQRQSPVSGELLTRLSNQKSHICQNLKKNIEISFDPYPTTYRQIKKIWNLDRKKYVKFTLVSFDSFKV